MKVGLMRILTYVRATTNAGVRYQGREKTTFAKGPPQWEKNLKLFLSGLFISKTWKKPFSVFFEIQNMAPFSIGNTVVPFKKLDFNVIYEAKWGQFKMKYSRDVVTVLKLERPNYNWPLRSQRNEGAGVTFTL